MKFASPLMTLLGAAAVVSAAPAPAAERRQEGYAVEILTAAASALVTRAANAAVDAIGDIANWNSARKEFTQSATAKMWQERPSQASAAVCYNMGYAVSRRNQMSDLTSLKLKKGPLHTDYDCFYMWGPDNHFNSQGDGGYINLSVSYDGNKCQFDKSTSDLYCS